MLGLTPLGEIHTAISLVAVVAGAIELLRRKRIASTTTMGWLYIITTVLTCITGFGIFQHGGFGKPHVLGIVTLLVLALALVAERGSWFGRRSIYVATVAYSATYFFHFIPAITEISTRLPAGAPLLPNADAPQLQVATAVLFVLFLVGATWQVRWLRRTVPALA